MITFDEFLEELDGRWTDSSGSRITLRVLGSTALFLQTTYVRGTKDGDVFETDQIDRQTRERLLAIAGPGTQMHHRHRIYLDIVARGVPLLPPDPLWHGYPLALVHFDVVVLDITDVVVSKLKRWNANDRDDVRAMVTMGHVDHDHLVERFSMVMERYKFDARSDLLPVMAERLNEIESDWFVVDETPFDFPEDVFR